MTVNRDTYVDDMLRTCGGDNVFADSPTRYPTVTLDEVRDAAPDVILLPDEPYRFRAAHRADFAPLADVPAVRAGRIRLVDGKLLSWYGPRIGDALERLPALLSRGRPDRPGRRVRALRRRAASSRSSISTGMPRGQALGGTEPHGRSAASPGARREQREALRQEAGVERPSGMAVETNAVRTTQRRRSREPAAARAEARAFAVASRRAAPVPRLGTASPTRPR